MTEHDDELDVWVPPGGLPAQRELPVVRMLAALAEAAACARRGESAAQRLHRGVASSLLADSALSAMDQMQATGEIPAAGSGAAWDDLMDLARLGQVQVGFALIVRGELAMPGPRLPVRSLTHVRPY
jgi:hypothetical protein